MAEEEKRDNSVQPAQGEQNVTQNDEGLLTTEEFEKLTKALEEGDFESFIESLGEDTKKKFQSYLDSKITKAIKTRETNLQKMQEEERLKQEKKFEELLKMKEKEILNYKKQVLIRDKGLPAEIAELIDGETEEEIVTKLEKAQQAYQKLVEERLKQELEQRLKGKTPQQKQENTVKITKDMLKKLTPQQINELFEKGEIEKILRGG